MDSLIIQGIPETHDGSLDDRKRADKEQFQIMMREIDMDEICTVSDCRRVGKLRADGSRLIKVRVNT